MRSKGIISLALAAVVLLPAVAVATITCEVSGDNPITIVMTSTAPIISAREGTKDNSTIIPGDCGSPFDYVTCTWSSTQIAPGPAEVSSFFTDDTQTEFECGPFTNEDGLPVELVEVSVE